MMRTDANRKPKRRAAPVPGSIGRRAGVAELQPVGLVRGAQRTIATAAGNAAG